MTDEVLVRRSSNGNERDYELSAKHVAEKTGEASRQAPMPKDERPTAKLPPAGSGAHGLARASTRLGEHAANSVPPPEPAADPTGEGGRDRSRAALLADYAEVLERGFCKPAWVSGQHGLNRDEAAWIAELELEAAVDEIRITHTWVGERGGWNLVAVITSPRHDRSYGLPRPVSNPLWRQRFEREWGQRLMIARRRVAAERAS